MQRVSPRVSFASVAAVALAALALASSAEAAARPVPCAELATNPAHGLAGNRAIKVLPPVPPSPGNPGSPGSPVSRIIPASGANAALCQVDFVYGKSDEQNITIRVGLPLNSVDGGTGGVEGAWNGRTQGIGGGGCSGNLGVTVPVNAGYVGSGTDTGHTGGNCEPGVNLDGTYNMQFIQDFIRNAMKQQILFSKAIAFEYYGKRPLYNYWNGCSTGGRQGYVLAQELGKELDGILANAPAMYWTRFQTAQMWGQIVMRNRVPGVVSTPITGGKLNQTTASAVAACDAADGVTDGVIDDPRTCHFSATANICGAPTAPTANCLTPDEAEAIDKIWDGPRNAEGHKIWFGLDRGTPLGGLNGTNPFALGVTQFHWDTHDRQFDWRGVSEEGYAQVAQDGSRNIADVTDTFGDLDVFRRSGGKLLTFVGANDQLIMPRGVIHYYRQMGVRYGKGGEPDFEKLQDFYRLFRAPGVNHCGGGSAPQPQNLFGALVNWVENGQAPDQIPAQITTGGVIRTRPLCPYPQTAIYNGTGSTSDAANFHCGGNLEATELVCADLLTRYKHEVKGELDFRSMGVHPRECAAQ